MKLARTVEHTVDVDEMLSRMAPKQFDEWWAEYQIEPWGIELPVETPKEGGSLGAFQKMAGF